MTRCCRSRRSISAHVSAPLDFFFVFGHVTLHACTRTPVLWEHSLRQGQETTRRSATHLGWERHGITLAGTCPETSEVVHQVCLASSAAMAAIPCSSSVSERATLRIGHSQGQCNVEGRFGSKTTRSKTVELLHWLLLSRRFLEPFFWGSSAHSLFFWFGFVNGLQW